VRSPDHGSTYRLPHRFRRCWIINQRGYANVVPSSGDDVYGSVYELNPKDEESLDKCEGFPFIYDKRITPIDLKLPATTSSDNDSNETATKRTMDVMVYIDFANTTRDVPRTEYIHRINMGLKDSLQRGIPQSYIDRYIRPFIPAE
jgi:gamma-glutamylcyclotransferase